MTLEFVGRRIDCFDSCRRGVMNTTVYISATGLWHCRVSTEIFDSVRCCSMRSERVELGFVNRRLDFAGVSMPTSLLPRALTLPSTWRTLPVVDGSLYNSIAVSPAASVDPVNPYTSRVYL